MVLDHLNPARSRLHSLKLLVNTNGSIHHQPDPEAISRIVLAEPKGKQIIFNHKGKQTEPWEVLQDSHGFKTCFPSENGLPVIIDLA